MVDPVVDEIDLPTGVDWRQAMYRRAISAREAFARHPWATRLIDSRETSGHGRLRYLDWVLGRLRRAGFSLEFSTTREIRRGDRIRSDEPLRGARLGKS